MRVEFLQLGFAVSATAKHELATSTRASTSPSPVNRITPRTVQSLTEQAKVVAERRPVPIWGFFDRP
jgi:hypothetical protein